MLWAINVSQILEYFSHHQSVEVGVDKKVDIDMWNWCFCYGCEFVYRFCWMFFLMMLALSNFFILLFSYREACSSYRSVMAV